MEGKKRIREIENEKLEMEFQAKLQEKEIKIQSLQSDL